MAHAPHPYHPSTHRPGTACALGATKPRDCSAGTFSASSRSATCSPCEPTYFQERTGKTECDACGAGFYCPRGSISKTPIACDPGTFVPTGMVGWGSTFKVLWLAAAHAAAHLFRGPPPGPGRPSREERPRRVDAEERPLYGLRPSACTLSPTPLRFHTQVDRPAQLLDMSRDEMVPWRRQLAEAMRKRHQGQPDRPRQLLRLRGGNVPGFAGPVGLQRLRAGWLLYRVDRRADPLRARHLWQPHKPQGSGGLLPVPGRLRVCLRRRGSFAVPFRHLR